MRNNITLEEGLSRLEGGISKAKLILDGIPTSALFTPEDYMNFYDCVYYMCIQHPPFDYSAELYERFQKALEEGISSKVLPALVDKDGAPILIELCNMWSNYKVMAKCLGRFFLYLDRHYACGKTAESLKDISIRCFRDLVCSGFYERFLNAAINLINQDRDENSVDKNLLKNVSAFLVEIGEQGNTCYYGNFEKSMLENTASYYHHLASQWLFCYSFADYIHKAKWCLNQEKEKASQYLYETSVEKLLKVVHWQLLGQTESILTEKQKAEGSHVSITYQELLSGCASLNLGSSS